VRGLGFAKLTTHLLLEFLKSLFFSELLLLFLKLLVFLQFSLLLEDQV